MSFKKSLFTTLLLFFSSTALSASLIFTFDNDGVYGVDHDYSNGVFLSYYSDDLALPVRLLPFTSMSSFQSPIVHRWGLTLGQRMWTPEDIDIKTPQPNQRPYTGLLYLQGDYLNLTSNQAERFSLMLGSTGPNSLAEPSQQFIHSLTGSTEPNGWDYQVKNQAIINLELESYRVLYRSALVKSNQHEIQNISRLMAGNFRSEIATGMMWRWGNNLESSVGGARISIATPVNAGMFMSNSQGSYLFLGAEGRYRFNDITIDGNTPDGVYSADLESLQASAVAGGVWYNSHYGASLSFSAKTPDFEQDNNSIYGISSLSLFMFF